MSHQCLSRTIVSWCIYDWAVSTFFSVILTFVFAAYFTSEVAKNSILGTHLWGNAMAIAGIAVALLSPIFGSIADYGGKCKRWLFSFTYLGIICTALLWFAYPSPEYITWTLTTIVFATIGFEVAAVFYNSFLLHLSPKGYIGRLSGWGWGCGYIGGLICLILVLTLFVKGKPAWLPDETLANVRICGPFVAIWIVLFSLPLFLYVKETSIHSEKTWSAIKLGLKQLKNTFLSLRNNKNIFLFLIARMIYTDGLNTLFAFGGIYAAGTFGMELSEVIEFGIVLNITAGIGAALFAWIDDYIGSKNTTLIALVGLIIVGTSTLLVETKTLFWVFAPFIGIFIGPSQAASRSLMARLAKPHQINEMFGLYALSGKATAFVGPWLLGTVTYYYQSQRAGMATIMFFFLIGGILLCFVKERL